MQELDYGFCATQGARGYQEDTALARSGATVSAGTPDPDAPAVLAVLADGMGGHAGGAVASSLACEEFLAAFGRERGSAQRRLLDALGAANLAIADKVAETPILSGMGCTLVGVSFGREGVEWVSVGDSPLLLYRRGEIALLNEDHSLAPELDRQAAAGKITFEQARRDPRRHVALGGDGGRHRARRCLAAAAAARGRRLRDPRERRDQHARAERDGAHRRCLRRGRRASRGGRADPAVEAARDPHQDNATVVAVRCRGP